MRILPVLMEHCLDERYCGERPKFSLQDVMVETVCGRYFSWYKILVTEWLGRRLLTKVILCTSSKLVQVVSRKRPPGIQDRSPLEK